MPEVRLLAAAGLVLLAGCGGGHTGGPDGPANEVTLSYAAGGAVKKSVLNCETPSANDKPSCDLLEELPASAFKPVPKGQSCSMIYGGPETATIVGTVNGTAIDATYKRTNGCEIARFKTVEALFAELAGN